MADKKISELTDGTSLQSGDEVVIARSGANFKVDPTQFGSSIDVTGTVTADGLTVSGNILLSNEGDELQFNTSSTPVNKIYSDDTYTTNGLTVFAENGVTLLSTNNYLLLDDTGTNEMVLNVDGGERMRVTSTGIDVTGTVTADGLTVDGAATIDSGGASPLTISRNSGASANVGIAFNSATNDFNIGVASTSEDFVVGTSSNLNTLNRLRVGSGGDISFYEDTGATAKFFWDASSERLTLKTSGAYALDVQASGTQSVTMAQFSNSNGSDKAYIALDSTGSGKLVLLDGGNNEDVLIGAQGDSYFNAGNVGIGTTSPASKLDLGTGNSAGDGLSFGLTSTELRRGNSGNNIQLSHFGNASIIIDSDNNDTNRYFNVMHNSGDSSTATELFRVQENGNVGIGTSSPSTNLEISDSSGAELRLTNSNTSLSQGSLIGSLEFYTSDTSGINPSVASSIKAVASTAGGAYGELIFSTIPGASEGDDATEAMRIDDEGKVGIGTTSPSAELHVYNGSANADIRAQGGGASDYISLFHGASTSGLWSIAPTTPMVFATNNAERARIDSSGNLLIGGTGTPTSSAGNFVLYNGTAPTGNATDGVILYAEDVSTSSELKVRDEAGNVTTLSPHNFDLIPEGPSEDMAWSYYSERDGKRINVDMLKAIRVLEQLSGEKLVHMV